MAAFNAAPPAAGKHWVRLRYVGPGEAPNRNEVGAQLLQSQWINAADIHAFINLPNKKHYEIIFLQERALQSFSQIFQAGSSEGFWKFWEIDTSTPQDECFIYVKFWTGRIADADVEQYIRRFCDILQPVHKLLDQFGLWYGVRRYKVKFRKNAEGGFLQIPNSISMGPYNGRISYQGQAQRCYVCHSTDHQVKDCNVIKCWKCGELGHKGKECVNTEKCNLCGVQGHSFFTCPNSYSNRARAQKQPRAEQQQATDQVRERPVAENNIEAEPVLAQKEQQQQLTSHQSAEGEEPAIESKSASTGAVLNADPSEGESEAGKEEFSSSYEEDPPSPDLSTSRSTSSMSNVSRGSSEVSMISEASGSVPGSITAVVRDGRRILGIGTRVNQPPNTPTKNKREKKSPVKVVSCKKMKD